MFWESHSKKDSILWVKFKKRRFKSLSNFSRRFNIKNKSSTLIEKRFIKEAQLNESFTKSSILWVIVEKKQKGFNSLSHFSRQDQSFTWVKNFVKKKPLGHVQKNGFNFYESCWKKGSISMSHVEKSVQFCELYSKKEFNSENEIQKNQFLESS